MADADNKIVNKTTVMEELEYWNVLYVFRRVKAYYRSKLRWMNPKDAQGMEADDFAMTVMIKIISEDVSWQRSGKNDFMGFVYGVTRGEWSHFLRANKDKTFISYEDIYWQDKTESNIRLLDRFNGF